MKLRHSLYLAIALCARPLAGGAKSHGRAAAGERWVATWATAQQLMPPNFSAFGPPPGRGPTQGGNSAAPGNAPAQNGARPPQAGRGNAPNPFFLPPFSNQTVRMVVHTTLGGRRVRVELSNMFNSEPVEIGAAHIARYAGKGAIVAGTDHALTFSGKPSFTIQPGVLLVSDPVNLEVAPLSDLAISVYVPHDAATPTSHMVGLHTTYVAIGNAAAAETLPEGTPTNLSYAWLTAVDVLAPADAMVDYAGPLKGFGIVLILRLGGGYHLVLAGLETALAAPGQRVAAGQTVGRMAKADTPAPELYFEIRKNSATVDPSRWLKTNRPKG